MFSFKINDERTREDPERDIVMRFSDVFDLG